MVVNVLKNLIVLAAVIVLGCPLASAVTVYHVDAIHGSDSYDGLTRETAFQTIQAGINAAANGDEVHVWPGIYTELINFWGKAITVKSAADAAVLQAPGDFAVSFYFAEGPGSVLKNFVIRGSEMAVFLAGSSPTLKNLTIVDNEFGISAYAGAAPTITNCIFWNNTDGDLYQCQARYSRLEGGGPALNNIDDNPQFADPANGDYHLKSVGGRFEPLLPVDQGWSEPVKLSELDDPFSTPQAPAISRDKLTLYYHIGVSGSHYHIAEARRDKPEGPFTFYRLLDEIYAGEGTMTPWISSDDLRLYYLVDRMNSGEHILQMAERTSKNDLWTVSHTFNEIHVNGYFDREPSLMDDELTMFWQSNRPGSYGICSIWVVSRNSINETFDPATIRVVSELNTNFSEGNTNAPCILPDGLVIYFGCRRNEEPSGDIYKATRNSLDEPFSNMEKIGVSSPTEGDFGPYVSPDETTIVYGKTTGIWYSEFHEGQWVMDEVTSPCIDAGDPAEDPAEEPMPNGGRINMGAYGGTAYASMSDVSVAVYHVDTIHGSDSNDGLTQITAFQTIQAGINAAEDGDEVHVWPGVYTGMINFQGKAITVQSATDAAVLQAPGDHAISCNSAEGPGSILKNFVIRGSEKAVFLAGSSPTLKNLTIVDNEFGISACSGAAPTITDCIFWNNADGDLYQCQASYSCLKNGAAANNNFYAYPQFADSTNGDYHLKSNRGRFVPLPPAEQGWSEPISYPELGVDNALTGNPYLSRDKLTLYITRWYPSLSTLKMFEASRNAPNVSYFSSEKELTQLGSAGGAWVSSDGLRMYYHFGTTSNALLLKKAERNSISDPWMETNTFTELDASGYADHRPELSEDELTIYWVSNRPGGRGGFDLWMATRNSIDQSFSNITNLAELNSTGDDNGFTIMPDGLTCYFSSKRGSYPSYDIYKATRNSQNGSFSNITRLEISSDLIDETEPYITPNGEYLYMALNTTSECIGIGVSHYNEGQWVIDDVTSPCIDAGDWAEDPAGERMPNGGRMNMGAYGGTAYASMSEWPVNGDVNRDGVVDLIDFTILSQNWLASLPWVQQ